MNPQVRDVWASHRLVFHDGEITAKACRQSATETHAREWKLNLRHRQLTKEIRMSHFALQAKHTWKVVALGVSVALASSAYAGDGVLEINQACAIAGCFSGDTPGYPVSINAAGSYRVTSNMTAPSTSAITVSAGGVILDLGGFTLSGPVICSGTPVTCTPSGYGPSGVEVMNRNFEGVVVRNGRVVGFGAGIVTGRSALVEDIIAMRNEDRGIELTEGSIARNVSVMYNRLGIQVQFGGQIISSTANFNREFGMATGGTAVNGGATIRDSSVFENTGTGIYDSGRSIIEGCIINGNTTFGIDSANGGTLIANTAIIANGSAAVRLRGDQLWEPGGAVTTFSGNTFTANNGGSVNAQITGAGAKRFLVPSICGTTTCAP